MLTWLLKIVYVHSEYASIHRSALRRSGIFLDPTSDLLGGMSR
jgi:hypothetical protein